MARRRDPLKTVLRLRGIREKQHLAEVAKVNQKIAEARERIHHRRDEYQNRPLVATTIDPARLRALQLSGIHSHELLQMAIEELGKTETQLAEARQAWSEASSRRKSAQRLSDKRELGATAVALRASQQSLDDLVVTMWNRPSSSGAR